MIKYLVRQKEKIILNLYGSNSRALKHNMTET